MIKKIAWDTFKNTGDINTFLEYKQIENIEKGIQEIQQIQKNHHSEYRKWIQHICPIR